MLSLGYEREDDDGQDNLREPELVIEPEAGLSMQALDEDHAAHQGRSISDILDIHKFHEMGYTGKGIKIAILDSGIGLDY